VGLVGDVCQWKVEVEIRGLVGIEVHGLRLSGIVRLG
jgi:hypothetical protein